MKTLKGGMPIDSFLLETKDKITKYNKGRNLHMKKKMVSMLILASAPGM